MHAIFKKVLFVGPENEFGGIGAVLDNYRKNISDFKFVPTFSSGNKGFKIFFFVRSLFKILRFLAMDPDIAIIHLHSASRGSFIRKSIICLIGKSSGKKIVFHIHSGGFKSYYENARFLQPYIRFILNLSDRVVCLSDQWLDFFTHGIKLNNVVVIGNPIETNGCDEKKTSGKVLHMLFLGKICDDKGVFGLIDFLKTNKYYLDSQIKLVIGGNGEEERLRKLLQEPSLGKHIEYCGWVQGEDKKRLICDCDIFILPSYMEGLPVSILEAMANGKPIIASNVGGIPSIVKADHNGWLIDPGAFYQLDIVFEQIFLNEKILATYRNNSLGEAARFSSPVILNELAELYTSLLNKSSERCAV